MWFVYGKPTNNPFGREKETESLIRLYKLGQLVGLIGTRRIGVGLSLRFHEFVFNLSSSFPLSGSPCRLRER
ncbi:hypothetical protein DDW12_05350 [Sulfolobus islandicus]|nr:hypothetical protein DDW12_05350 [Sulfolobus islandicus]